MSQDDAGEDARQFRARQDMVAEIREIARELYHLCPYPVSERILAAMARVPRHFFIPCASRFAAYGDHPLPIGCGQTISQPYIVALMTELLEIGEGCRVLDVGTGSGYQAAILAELGAEVCSVEIVEALSVRAADLLRELGYAHVRTRVGDGNAGWLEHAPYDAIVVAAAADRVPPALLEQLKPGGRIVIPVRGGGLGQELLRILKLENGSLLQQTILPVSFVPLVGS